MPVYMRKTGFSVAGQFEEDCDWCLPVVAFPEEYATFFRNAPEYFPANTDPVEVAWQTFRRWHEDLFAMFQKDTNIVHMNANGVTYDSAACAAAR